MANENRNNGKHSYAEYDPRFRRTKGGLMDKAKEVYGERFERLDKKTIFVYAFYAGLIGAIAWLFSAVLGLAFPNSWLLGVIGTLGKWAFWIGAIVVLLIYLRNIPRKIKEWINSVKL